MLAFSYGLLSCQSCISGGGNPYADAKIRASLSVNVKNARKPAPIACMVLASKDLREVFIVIISRVWLWLTRIARFIDHAEGLFYQIGCDRESVGRSDRLLQFTCVSPIPRIA